ncbi:MAG TPA: hypothetical protein PLV93_06930 [Microthrixaceae bacterium]|nr:hypothetical protein [Microthrixaceae bacterium]HNI35117.1 hypothetical protein [Microthrixaceae bacterium]
MEISAVTPITRDELVAAVRRTRLQGFDQAEVYADADITLTRFDTDDLTPAQRYVLEPNVATVLELREALLAHGVDILALDGGVWVEIDGERIPVIPPIVEHSVEPASNNQGSRAVALINDGIHRVYAARTLGLPITVVHVTGATHPYYALALDGWADVTPLSELPDGFQKKAYRIPDNYKALFRDFNALFPGVQQQRKRSNPDHLKA